MYPRRHNVLNLSVGPSVPSSVRPFVRYETCKHDILKTSEPRFDEYYHKWSTEPGHEMINFGSHEAKGQGRTRPEIDVEVW